MFSSILIYEVMIKAFFSVQIGAVAARDCNPIQQIPVIYALDPASPLFEGRVDSLRTTDASYIEVLHTAIPVGYETPAGTVDVYINYGRNQPNTGIDLFQQESHRSAFHYLARTFRGEVLIALKCESFEAMQQDQFLEENIAIGGLNMEAKLGRSGIFSYKNP